MQHRFLLHSVCGVCMLWWNVLLVIIISVTAKYLGRGNSAEPSHSSTFGKKGKIVTNEAAKPVAA